MASNGVVTAEAKGLFERANAAEPEDVMAQYYLGLSAKQEGRRDEALKRWNALASGARPGAEWLPLVKNAIARIDEKGPTFVAPPTAAAAATSEHNGSIEAMVERLAERLKKDGSDVPAGSSSCAPIACWESRTRPARPSPMRMPRSRATRKPCSAWTRVLRNSKPGLPRPHPRLPGPDRLPRRLRPRHRARTRTRSPPPRRWRRPSAME